MKVLLALAFVLWAGTDAFHTHERHMLHHHNEAHRLSQTPWPTGKISRYELMINMTAGIPGMTSQVAKSLMKMDINIKGVTDTEYMLQIEQVGISHPRSSVSSPDTPLEFEEAPELLRELRKTIRFVYQDGEVKSYTLENSETLQSKTIKRGILRHLQMKIHPSALNSRERPEYPIVYNTTETDELGTYDVYYGINISPYPWFPYDSNVYNVSKTIDYDPYGYPAYHEHHNFAAQGCPNVCKLGGNTDQSPYGPGCPAGFEPHQTPLKASKVVHHNYRLSEDKMVIESMMVKETNVANMYDQDILMTVESKYVLLDVSSRGFPEPSTQQTRYQELNAVPSIDDLRDAHPKRPEDVSHEYNWIYGIFESVSAPEVVSLAEDIWERVARAVVAGEIETTQGQEVAHDVGKLQDVLALLKKSDLKNLWRKVIDLKSIRRAGEKEKVKRQILLDVLPLCGTDASIEFLTELVKEKKLLIWEAKEVLEAIPSNIIEITQKNIQDLMALLELPHIKQYHVLHSAAYLTVSHVIREGCVIPMFTPDATEDEDGNESNRNSKMWHPSPRSQRSRSLFGIWDNDDDDNEETPDDDNYDPETRKQTLKVEKDPKCSEETVRRYLEETRSKLQSANKLQEKIVYIQAIARVGYEKTLEILKPYIYGVADDTARLAPGDVDFLKTVTLYALHTTANLYPYETELLVAPIYFNRTEAPRVRNAAFSLLIRCQPTLALLQHVAQDSWDEPSKEVGSFVYSSLVTFGNASTPCMKLTADRIKLIISQVKTYDIGIHHSKSIIKTFFDELRNFGIEKHMSVVYSNESIVPSSLYTALQYNIQSMRDVLFQFASNIQGVQLDELLDSYGARLLGLTPSRNIAPDAENDIFKTLELIPRLPKEMRITIYKKIFYAASYHYLDREGILQYLYPMKEYFNEYFSQERGLRSGHYVKIFIPSSIHSLTYSSIGFPIDMRMKHPLVFSLKVESRRQSRNTPISFSYYIRPSVYYATYHKVCIANIADKHVYGVYQDQKYTFTLPVEASVYFDTDSNILELKYKLPEAQKRVFRHHSEAGTYETELNIRSMYGSNEYREPIKTVPALFKRERVISGWGLPALYINHHTEDIQEQYIDLPRNLKDVVELIVEGVRNPGWRRRDINATIMSKPSSPVNEVTFRISYNKTLDMPVLKKSGNPSQASWFGTKDHKDEEYDEDTPEQPDENERDILEMISRKTGEDPEQINAEMATKVYDAFCGTLSKVSHEFYIQMETSPSKNLAELRFQYNHTLDKMVHLFKAWAEAKTSHNETPKKMCLTHLMQFYFSPSEFHYDIRKYSRQYAPFFNAITFGGECKPLSQSDVISHGYFKKVPSQDFFSDNDFVEMPDQNSFVPETHRQCLKDIREGKSQSPECMAAAIEESHFNKFHIKVETRQDLPPALKNVTYKLDRALKQYYFSHVDVNRLNVRNPPKTFEMTMNYIEKFTDEPVVDVYMKKPDENVIYHKVDPEYLEPLSSIYSLPENYIHRVTNNTYLPSCGLMEKYVRTYDMKIYPLPRESCTYVLSTHCTEKKRFAVLAKRLGSDDTKEITVHVADQKVILKPSRSGSEYTILHNGKSIEVRLQKPVLLDEETMLHAFLVPVFGHEVNNVLYVHVDKIGIRLQYDGKNVKLQVNPIYKGELCGLCSEFDGEITREFRGPNQCWYLTSEDFVHSSVIDGSRCGVPKKPRDAVICPSGEYIMPSPPAPFNPTDDDRTPYPPEDNDDDTYRRGPTGGRFKPHTVIIQRGEYVCFSTQPVPVCEEGTQPEEEYSVPAAFHCLPKYDVTTRRLIQESKTRVLGELSNKKVDFTESVPAPRSCSSY